MKFVAKLEGVEAPQYLTPAGGTTSLMCEALTFALPLVPAIANATYRADGWWEDRHGNVLFRAIEFRPDGSSAAKNIRLAQERLEHAAKYAETAARSAEVGAINDALQLLRSLRGALKYITARADQARVQLESTQPTESGSEGE